MSKPKSPPSLKLRRASKFKSSKLALAVAISTSLLLVGCIPKIEESNPEGSREYLKGKVVKGFPALPLYEKAKVLETYGYQGSYGGAFVTGEEAGKVVKFYQESLGALGWESALRQQSENNFLFDVKNEKYKGVVIVNTAADGKKSAITIAVKPR